LLVWFSQSGQTRDVVSAFADGLADVGWEVDRHELVPAHPYPFPWKVTPMFGVITDVVKDEGVPIEQLDINGPYDLVLVGTQVWYLQPTPPVQAFLAEYGHLVEGTDVISVISCRNMWFHAARRLRLWSKANGARHLGEVVAIDQGQRWLTFFTTPRWLLTGRTDPVLFFPPFGVSPDRLVELREVGRTVAKRWADLSSEERTSILSGIGASDFSSPVAAADTVGGMVFRKVGQGLSKLGDGPVSRTLAAGAFAGVFTSSVLLGIPSVILLRNIFPKPVDRWVAERLGFSDPDSAPVVKAKS
jgi:hypothetical protein